MAPRQRKQGKQQQGCKIEVVLNEHDDFLPAASGQKKIDPRMRVVLVASVVAVVVFFFGLVIPKNLFNDALHVAGMNDGYTLSWFVSDLSDNVSSLFALFTGDTELGGYAASHMVSYGVIMLCGAGLALCGTVYQGTFHNALVSPSSLGVMSGAGLGMALWVALLYRPEDSHGLWFETGSSSQTVDFLTSLWNSYSLSICSFVGCCIVVGLVLLVIGTVGRGSTSGLMMIITGQIIGAVMGGITSSLRYYFITVDPEGPQAEMMMQLQISSFYRSYSVIDLLAIGVPVLVLFLVVMRFRDELTLLAFSEAEARAMGVETKRLRFAIVALSTFVTAVIVSFCGRVGFVGFMLPLLARRLVGPNFTYLVPAAMVLGGAFVLTAYVLIVMILGDGYATMSGMFISIGGVIVFLVSVIRGTGGKRGAF